MPHHPTQHPARLQMDLPQWPHLLPQPLLLVFQAWGPCQASTQLQLLLACSHQWCPDQLGMQVLRHSPGPKRQHQQQWPQQLSSLQLHGVAAARLALLPGQRLLQEADGHQILCLPLLGPTPSQLQLLGCALRRQQQMHCLPDVQGGLSSTHQPARHAGWCGPHTLTLPQCPQGRQGPLSARLQVCGSEHCGSQGHCQRHLHSKHKTMSGGHAVTLLSAQCAALNPCCTIAVHYTVIW